MSTTTNATLKILLSWSQTDTDSNNNSKSDAGTYLYQGVWATGTGGTGVLTQQWHEERTLTSGECYTYNMTGLLRSFLNSSGTASFSNIRSIYLENTSVATGVWDTGIPGTGTGTLTGVYNCDIAIRATGVNGFSGIFNNNSGNYVIPARSPMCLTNYISGWPITGDTTNLYVHDVGCGSGSSYRISILGLI